MPDINALIEETEAQILEGSGAPVHFTLEYVDFPESNDSSRFNERLVSLLKEKYYGRSFDLVITLGDTILKFAEASRAELFPAAAIVFFEANSEEAASKLKRQPQAPGVMWKLDYLPTLQLALRQNPGTRHVIVVCGSSEFEKFELSVARAEFRSYESNLDFQYWTGLKFPELASRLATVESGSIVLFLDFTEDSEGKHFTPSRVLRSVSSTASRPIYGTVYSFIGSGAVGGSVAHLQQAGTVLGQDGLLVLNRAKPESIPVTTGEFQRTVFDWRQLHRWRMSTDQLPPGSAVLYWEHSAWELYHWRFIGIAAIVLLQTLLILLLLVTRARRRRAENELQKSEEKFSKVFREAPMAVTLTDARTHRYIDVNETFERFSGYSRKEIIGHTVLELEIWVDPSERERAVKNVLKEGHLSNIEFQYRRKGGELRMAQASAELIEIEGETCVLGIAADITDRTRAEQALQESEKRFRLMADSAPVLMWMSGPDKLCTDFNKEWLRFTGRTMQEELGEGWTHSVQPEDLQACLDSYAAAFDARQSFAIEYRLRRHDGKYRWMLDRGTPRFLDNGGFAGYIGCCIDITEEKEAKATHAEFSGRLIQAQEEESARIARELHDDINQRLALLANELQQLQQSTAERREASHNKLQELWQITSEITADIQQLSHELHPSKLHYLGLAAAVRDLCQEFSKLSEIEVECTVRDLPRDVGKASSLTFFRVVQESLRNVAKHSHAHHVKVELVGESQLIRLRVSDDGIGFNPEPTGKQGLGLVSMQERLRLAGGQFSISSQPSLGTQVEATIPTAPKSIAI